MDAIICNVTDGAPGEGRDFGNFDVLVDGEFLLQDVERISLDFMIKTCFDDFERV